VEMQYYWCNWRMTVLPDCLFRHTKRVLEYSLSHSSSTRVIHYPVSPTLLYRLFDTTALAAL